MSKHLKKWLVVIVILMQIPLVLPFFNHGFFPTHDNVQVQRAFDFFQTVLYEKRMPSWSSDLLYGYGYPLFSFYPPLTYLISSAFSLIGLNYLLAVKATFIFVFVLGAIGFFRLANYLFGPIPAFISSIIYSLAPYRAVDVYVRGNLPEFLAMSLFPYILLYNLRVLSKHNQLDVIKLAFLICLVVLTHNISSFIFLLFFVAFNVGYIIVYRDKFIYILRAQKHVFLSVIVGLGLSCFFWFPVLIERSFVVLNNFSSYPYYLFFVSLLELWKSTWGYEGFHRTSSMSLQLGQVIIVSSVLALFVNVIAKKSKMKGLVWLLGILFVLFTFLEIEQSNFIWKTFSIFSYIQFPWRFHIVTTNIGCLLTGYLVYIFCFKKYLKSRIWVFIVSTLLVYSALRESYEYFKPREYSYGVQSSETTTWDDEYLPRWVVEKPKSYSSVKVFGTTSSNVSAIEWGYYRKSFEVNLDRTEQIKISHIYYPGWEVTIDGVPAKISYDNPNGLMETVVPAGNHKVVYTYVNTWWRKLANTISIIFLCGTLLRQISSTKRKS